MLHEIENMIFSVQNLDQLGDHAVFCAKGRGRFRIHTAIARCVARFAREAGVEFCFEEVCPALLQGERDELDLRRQILLPVALLAWRCRPLRTAYTPRNPCKANTSNQNSLPVIESQRFVCLNQRKVGICNMVASVLGMRLVMLLSSTLFLYLMETPN